MAPSYGYGGSPAPRRRHWWLIGAVIVVVIILVLGLVAYVATPPPAINVTGINFDSPDNACGLNGASDYGFTGNASQSLELQYQIYNFLPDNATTGCTIANITTTTPGFTISGADTPLTIPPGANSSEQFWFQINFPSSPYTGILTLVIT
jgi:hypothetical protein